MFNHKLWRACPVLCVTMMSCPVTLSFAATVDASSSDQGPQLSEIIVTAEKRSEKLQDVPSTVSVLSGADLESQGLNQLSDYAKEVPGLNVTAAAGAGVAFPVIRGITLGQGGNHVGVYLDDIPFTPSTQGTGVSGYSFDPDLAEIDHIEVLAGPQSTLYGANSVGGAIKFVTKQPDLNNFTGSVGIDGSQVDGGGAGYRVRASVNLPLVADRLAVTLSAVYREDPGFVDNAYFGAKNINWDSVEGGRLAILFKISDDLSTTLAALTQHIASPSQQEVYLNPQALRPLLGTLAYSSPIEPAYIIDTSTVSDSTRWDMHFATLTNVASYAHLIGNTLSDATLYGSFIGAPPQDYFRDDTISASNRLTDELRWASAPGRAEWLLAAFYTEERGYAHQYTQTLNASGRFLPSTDPFYNIYDYRYDTKYTEKALFGNFTYHLTDQIEGTVGMRYARNDQPVHIVQTGDFGAEDARTYGQGSANTYLGTISYTPESNTTLYARAASGYFPGGSTVVPPSLQALGVSSQIGPEYLWNYEVGIKGSAWDRSVVYSADVFHMLWKDLQVNVVVDGLGFSGNAGSARSDGVEASLQFVPLERLIVKLNGAYTNARITADLPQAAAVSGQPLPYSAKFTTAAVLDYQFTSVHGFTPTTGLIYAYRGSSNTEFAGSTTVTASSVYRLPSYATLDLRGGIDWSQYSLMFRVENVTDRYGLTYAAPSVAMGAPLEGYVIKPRTFGLSLSARF
jgi:iron complex outermembrane receptor protein